MKSAYGLKIPEPDYELTSVGPGTPGGDLLRRYWMPVCLSEDLKDVPKRIRLLGEDLIVFRDGQGNAGLLFFRCSHRGTSLEYGKIEERGIRCCYHGWLYDVTGNILDMPLEPADSPFKNHIQHPCYPVKEFGGLVFAYMGPLDKMPEFPIYDVWTQAGKTLKARMGPRVGGRRGWSTKKPNWARNLS
jgi:phenylpropionate dioxygenase-like ring-hydroxylating dioxygenase large terminal subunit